MSSVIFNNYKLKYINTSFYMEKFSNIFIYKIYEYFYKKNKHKNKIYSKYYLIYLYLI